MTPQELALWFQLRQLRAQGHHFHRQSPEGPYKLDFVCRKSKLVVQSKADAGLPLSPDD